MAIQHVAGKKAGQIMLYALSTCGWCRKTRELLEKLGVEYDYEYVDQLEGEKREEAMNVVRRWNAACSFPTMIIDNKTCIVGYKEDEIRKAVEK